MKSYRVWRSTWLNNRKIFAAIGFLLPGFMGVLCFVLLPFVDVVRRSFLTVVTGEWKGIGNYTAIFQNQAFLLAVKNTLCFTAVCIPLLAAIGLLIAIPLSAKAGNVQTVKTMYLLPLAIPTATMVLIWKMLFYNGGFLNLFLTRIGTKTGWFGPVHINYLETDLSFWVLVSSYLWKNMGYTVVLWIAGIMGVSTDIREAARVDGASGLKCFIYVVLPNLKGTFYTILILSFLNSFKVYREAYLVSGAYPQEKIFLLQHLFNNWFVKFEFDKMAAAAVCTGGCLLVFILLLQRVWDRR